MKGTIDSAIIDAKDKILKNQKKGRRRWVWRKITSAKLKYWIASSFDKLGEKENSFYFVCFDRSCR